MQLVVESSYIRSMKEKIEERFGMEWMNREREASGTELPFI